jgi:hypothetical protein
MNNKDDINIFDIVKSENTSNRYTGIRLCQQFKKALKIDTLKSINDKNISVSDKKQYTLENEIDLYNFYKDNLLENNLILNKTETSKYFNVSVSTIRRMNDKLKEKDMLYSEGKNIYLRVKEVTINE